MNPPLLHLLKREREGKGREEGEGKEKKVHVETKERRKKRIKLISELYNEFNRLDEGFSFSVSLSVGGGGGISSLKSGGGSSMSSLLVPSVVTFSGSTGVVLLYPFDVFVVFDLLLVVFGGL